MKFFAAALFCLLLLEPLEGSALSLDRPTRAVNTTLKTNFNGTYQRKDPCSNTEVETSSYLASHELHHHTKDNWSDYTHKCSTIIINFLQTIGNLIRFNHKQNGSFNFYLNTSISQKQDVSGKQESCESLPTIIIEATDCEIPLNPCRQVSGARNEKNNPSEEKKTRSDQSTKEDALPLTDSPNRKDSTAVSSCETKGILDEQYPVTLSPLGYAAPEDGPRPGGEWLEAREKSRDNDDLPVPSPPGSEIKFPGTFFETTNTEEFSQAISHDLPRDIVPVYEPKTKYFKTSLRLTPQTDPENGTVQPRVQYMTANLVTPPTGPQPTSVLGNQLLQPESSDLPPNQGIEPTPPLPEPFQPSTPAVQPPPYNSIPASNTYGSPESLTQTAVSFPQPQPAELLSNGPPAPFDSLPVNGPDSPTVSLPLQPTTTTNYNQETNRMEFGPSTPQPFDITSPMTSPNFDSNQTVPPEVQTQPNYSSTTQNFPSQPSGPGGEPVSYPPELQQPPTVTPYFSQAEATPNVQFQPEQSYAQSRAPSDILPATTTNENIFPITQPPPQPLQSKPLPEYPDQLPVEEPSDASLSGPDQQPSVAPYRRVSPRLLADPANRLPYIDPFISAAPPSGRPTDYPAGQSIDSEFNTPSTFSGQQQVADSQSAMQPLSSTTTIEQETITIDQTQSTPQPAVQPYPGSYRGTVAVPENPPNNLGYPSAPEIPSNLASQQFPSTPFPEYSQEQSEQDTVTIDQTQSTPQPAVQPYPDSYRGTVAVPENPPINLGYPSAPEIPSNLASQQFPSTPFPEYSQEQSEQETVTIDQTQSTPEPAIQPYPGLYRDTGAGPAPENPSNDFDSRSVPGLPSNIISQQSLSSSVYPQSESLVTEPFSISNGDSQPLRQSLNPQMLPENSERTQNLNEDQVRVMPDMSQSVPVSPRQESLEQTVEPPAFYMTTPMPFAPALNPEQTATDTVTTSTSSSSVTTLDNYGESAFPTGVTPLSQQRYFAKQRDFPTPPPESFPAPEGVSPDQSSVDSRAVTPEYLDDPNSFVGGDVPTTTAPQPFPSRPFPDPQYGTSVPETSTSDSTSVSQSTEMRFDPSVQAQPSLKSEGSPVTEEATPGDLTNPSVFYPLRPGPSSPDVNQISSDSLVPLTPSPDEYTLRPDQQPFVTTPADPRRFQESFLPSGQASSLPSEPPVTGGPVAVTLSQEPVENPGTILEAQQYLQPFSTPVPPIQSRNEADSEQILVDNVDEQSPKTLLGSPEQVPDGQQRGQMEVPVQPPFPESLPTGSEPPVQYKTTFPPNANTFPENDEAVTPSNVPLIAQRPNQAFGVSEPPSAFPDGSAGYPSEEQSSVITPREPRPSQFPNFEAEQPSVNFPESRPQIPAPYSGQPELSQPPTSKSPYWNDNSNQAGSFSPATLPPTQNQPGDHQAVDQTIITTLSPIPQVLAETGNVRYSDGKPEPSFIPPQPSPPVQPFDDFSQRRYQQTADFVPEPSATISTPPSEALIKQPDTPFDYNNPRFLSQTNSPRPLMSPQVRPVEEPTPASLESPFAGVATPQPQPQPPFGFTSPNDPAERQGSPTNGGIEPQPYPTEGVNPPTGFNPQRGPTETVATPRRDSNDFGQTTSDPDNLSLAPNFSSPPQPQTTVTSYQTTTTQETTESVINSDRPSSATTQVPLQGPPQNIFNNPPLQPQPNDMGNGMMNPPRQSFPPPNPQPLEMAESREQSLDSSTPTTSSTVLQTQTQNTNIQSPDRNNLAPLPVPEQRLAPYQGPAPNSDQQNLQSLIRYNNQPGFRPPQQRPEVFPPYLTPMAPPQRAAQFDPSRLPGRFDAAPLNPEDRRIQVYNQPRPGQVVDYPNRFNTEPVPTLYNTVPATPQSVPPPMPNTQPNSYPNQPPNYVQESSPEFAGNRPIPNEQQTRPVLLQAQPTAPTNTSEASKSIVIVEEITTTETPRVSAPRAPSPYPNEPLNGGMNFQRPPSGPYRPTPTGLIPNYRGEPVGYFGPRSPPPYPVNNQQVEVLPYQRPLPFIPNYPNSEANYPQRMNNVMDSTSSEDVTSYGRRPAAPFSPNDGEITDRRPNLDGNSPGQQLPADRRKPFDEPAVGWPQPGSFDSRPMTGPRRGFAPSAVPYEPPARPPTLPTSLPSNLPPPPQEMPGNPLLQAMESHLAVPTPGRPYLPPGPPSSFPGRFDRDNQNGIDTTPPAAPPSPGEWNPPPAANFVNSQGLQPNTPVDTPPTDIPNRPQADPQALVPEQTAPSNGPDPASTGRIDYVASPLRNSFYPDRMRSGAGPEGF